jgi:hypothetical protein
VASTAELAHVFLGTPTKGSSMVVHACRATQNQPNDEVTLGLIMFCNHALEVLATTDITNKSVKLMDVYNYTELYGITKWPCFLVEEHLQQRY